METPVIYQPQTALSEPVLADLIDTNGNRALIRTENGNEFSVSAGAITEIEGRRLGDKLKSDIDGFVNELLDEIESAIEKFEALNGVSVDALLVDYHEGEEALADISISFE